MTLLETTLRNRIRNLGLTMGQVAELSGVRVQILVPGLNGRSPLSLTDIDRLRTTLNRIESVVNAFRPVPLSLKDTRTLKFLLKKLEDGELDDVMTPHARELAAELDHLLCSGIEALVG